MILNKTADGTGINSNILALQMKTNPELRDKLHDVTSWGPLPVYPGVANSELPEEVRYLSSRRLRSTVSDWTILDLDPKPHAYQGRLLLPTLHKTMHAIDVSTCRLQFLILSIAYLVWEIKINKGWG
ncbi:uncharacterized protein LOC119743616 [Patiria miniata]|uniref:Uncharacterized protein n=1 Tax=Patiria miniata TaxID=46514 RepID=A0A914BJF5_PATMI|nr:uncharacterized protein LOC119743616 [Patiria miniata]